MRDMIHIFIFTAALARHKMDDDNIQRGPKAAKAEGGVRASEQPECVNAYIEKEREGGTSFCVRRLTRL